MPHQFRPRFPFSRPFMKLPDCPYFRWGFFRPDQTRWNETLDRKKPHAHPKRNAFLSSSSNLRLKWEPMRTVIRNSTWNLFDEKGKERERQGGREREKRNEKTSAKNDKEVVQKKILKKNIIQKISFKRRFTYDTFDFFVSSTGNRGLKSAETNGSVPNFFFPVTSYVDRVVVVVVDPTLRRFSTRLSFRDRFVRISPVPPLFYFSFPLTPWSLLSFERFS